MHEIQPEIQEICTRQSKAFFQTKPFLGKHMDLDFIAYCQHCHKTNIVRKVTMIPKKRKRLGSYNLWRTKSLYLAINLIPCITDGLYLSIIHHTSKSTQKASPDSWQSGDMCLSSSFNIAHRELSFPHFQTAVASPSGPPGKQDLGPSL